MVKQKSLHYVRNEARVQRRNNCILDSQANTLLLLYTTTTIHFYENKIYIKKMRYKI
jgi:hypothetical protein